MLTRMSAMEWKADAREPRANGSGKSRVTRKVGVAQALRVIEDGDGFRIGAHSRRMAGSSRSSRRKPVRRRPTWVRSIPYSVPAAICLFPGHELEDGPP